MTTTIATTPTPADMFRAVGGWFKNHPKARNTLIFFAVCTICYIFNTNTAIAETQTESRAFDLPLVGVTDTSGVPIWRYLELPLDPGNGFATSGEGMPRQIRYTLASILWAFYAMPILLLIAMVEWIVSFEWLSWVAAPFETVASGVSGVMETWMIATLGVAISALWIGIGYLRGRTGAATVEFVMVVLVFGVIASPVADPFTWMSGGGSDAASDSGFISQAATAGAEAGGMTINQEAEAGSITLAASIIDITLRDTALNMAFGSSLTGDCAAAWNDAAAADSSLQGDEIREEVIQCSEEVANANQTNSYVWLFDYIMGCLIAVGVIFLLAIFLFYLIWQVLQAFISAVMTVIRAYLALWPGNSRTAWLNSIFQVIVSGVLIGIYIFMLTVYMWGMGVIKDAIPTPLMRLGSLLIGILIIVAAITFWKMKKSGQSIGERLAEAFGKTGLSKDGPAKQPSNFGSTAKNLTGSAVRKWNAARRTKRMINGLGLAAGLATGGAGGIAAKAISSSAAGGLAAKAAQGAIPGANLPGVEGVLLGSGVAQPRKSAASVAPPEGAGSAPSSPLSGNEDLRGSASAHSGTQPAASVAPPEGAGSAPSSPLSGNEDLRGSASAHSGTQPAASVAPPEGVESAPSSDVSTEVASSNSHLESTRNARGSLPGGVPVEARPVNQINNIPSGNYGGTFVHKNGQMHQPMTINPDGTPVKNIPQEEKMLAAVKSGDTWVITNAPPARSSTQARQPDASRSEQPASQTQEQRSSRSTRIPDRPHTTATTRPRPVPVDVAARASQGGGGVPQPLTPRAMQARDRGQFQSEGDER